MMGWVPHPGVSSSRCPSGPAPLAAPHLPASAPQTLPSDSSPPGCPGPSWLGVPSSADSEGPGRALLLRLSLPPSLCRAAFFTEHPNQLPEAASGRAEDPEVPQESRGGPAASVVGLRSKGAQIAGHSGQTGACPLLSWGGQLHPPAASVRATHGDPASGAGGSEAGDAAPQAHSQGPACGQLHPSAASVRAMHGDPASGAGGSEAGDAASPAHSQGPARGQSWCQGGLEALSPRKMKKQGHRALWSQLPTKWRLRRSQELPSRNPHCQRVPCPSEGGRLGREGGGRPGSRPARLHQPPRPHPRLPSGGHHVGSDAGRPRGPETRNSLA